MKTWAKDDVFRALRGKVTVLFPSASRNGFAGTPTGVRIAAFQHAERENFNTGSTRKPNILADNGDEESKMRILKEEHQS